MIRLIKMSAAATLVASGLGLAACGGSAGVPTAPGALLESALPGRQPDKAKQCVAKRCIYVANTIGPGSASGSITVYSAKANGDATPVREIVGTKTGLGTVWGVALDADRNIYVANYSGSNTSGDLTIYPAGSHGNVAPSATIIGLASGDVMVSPSDVAVDSAGNMYATAYGSNSISVYAPGSNGYAEPIQYISGSNTELLHPGYVAVTKTKKILVANFGGGSINVYAAGATGNAAPVQQIFGTKTGLYSPTGVAVDDLGRIYASSCNCSMAGAAASITVYAKGANGNVAPIRTISGSNTELNGPNGIALDSSGNIYVSQYFSNSVTVYANGANGDVAPIRTISGSATSLDEPAGLTVH